MSNVLAEIRDKLNRLINLVHAHSSQCRQQCHGNSHKRCQSGWTKFQRILGELAGNFQQVQEHVERSATEAKRDRPRSADTRIAALGQMRLTSTYRGPETQVNGIARRRGSGVCGDDLQPTTVSEPHHSTPVPVILGAKSSKPGDNIAVVAAEPRRSSRIVEYAVSESENSIQNVSTVARDPDICGW